MKNILCIAAKYAYDALGQLVRVNDPHENATWVYNYDRGGNITSKVKYAYTTDTLGTALETIPYAYGDANWKDKLTAYNGTAITYDAIGNPLNDGSWTYEWAVGRQLKKMSREGQSLTFKYDHNGMRIQKVLEHSWYPETTNYTYHGNLLTHMNVVYTDFDEIEHTDKLHFFYDAQSRPAKVRFNGTIYTYLHNLQGDIVGILDNTGNLVVEYKYDAWGKLLSTTGSLADTLGVRNPFRYRSYVYDEESGLYYLHSRCYKPEYQRFVNADTQLDTRGFSANQFAYCGNSPVVRVDTDGRLWGTVFSFIAAAAIEIAAVAAEALTTAAIVLGAAVVVAVAADTATSSDPLISADTAVQIGMCVAVTELMVSNSIANIQSIATSTETTTTSAARVQRERPCHRHHIVAKNAWRAAPARRILQQYGISVNDPINLVAVPAKMHASMHTSSYYAMVNSRLLVASLRGEEAVKTELRRLNSLISSASILYYLS